MSETTIIANTKPDVGQVVSDQQKAKDRHTEFAEDLVYTINHAIVCAASDFFDPFIGAWTQQYLGRRLVLNPLHDWAHNKFDHHGHDHHGHDHHDHDHHHHAHDHHAHGGSFWGNVGHWVVGEAVGDIGAVPFTLAMQRYTPGVMKGIQYSTEPFLGPGFRWSAKRYAQAWAKEQGLAMDAPEVKQREEELYQHEVEHLPHAFVWTGSAAGLNILTQKYITGNKSPTSHLIAGKALGSLGTLVLVLGLRTLAPKKIQQLDEWNTENIAEPITRRVSRWLGIDDDTVERVLQHERDVNEGQHLVDQDIYEKNSRHGQPDHDSSDKETHEQLPDSKITSANRQSLLNAQGAALNAG